jgi:6-phosphogluconolactonase (cycloisomerase 2 family)
MKLLPTFSRVRKVKLIAGFALVAALAMAAGCGPTNNLPELTGEYAYVANTADGSISVFSIDTTTGALTLIEQVSVKPGFRVFGLALHWSNEFLYATIDDASEVEEFDIADGTYSGQIFLHNGPYTAANGPRAVALNSNGTFLFATNYGGTAQVVSQYLVDQSTGVLTANGTAATGIRPFGVAVDPAGNCAYVANTGDPSLSEYGVSNKGALEFDTTVSIGSFSEGPGPELVAVQFNPNRSLNPGQTVYVTDDNLGLVHQLPVFSELIGVRCTTVPKATDIAAKGKAFGISLHPMGKFLYTGNSSSNSISIFSVSSTGQLTLAGQETKNLNDVLSVAVDLQGKFLYAANFGDSTIAQYSINQTTDMLTPIGAGKVKTENPAKTSGPITIITTVNPFKLVRKL